MQPGMVTGNLASMTKESLLYKVKSDMYIMGNKFRKVPKKKKNKPKEKWINKAYIVAFVYEPWVDYHWYRQDKGGKWSHKPGATRVKRTKKSGKGLPTGQYKSDGYSNFIGYYYVKK